MPVVSIHVPLAEHDSTSSGVIYVRKVSIHVPLAEHDPAQVIRRFPESKFQFTCPSRSTTQQVYQNRYYFQVSIHVPLAEHDGHDRR